MFLVDSAQAAGDWEGTMGAIETVLKRADAEVVFLRKWSERRLAYDMGKVSRGTYLLCYFRADPQRIMGVEKDVRLSEMILRMLILSAEGRPEGFNEKDINEEPVEEAKAPADVAPEAGSASEAEDDAEATDDEEAAPAESDADTPAEETKEQ
jgi:small subunit ribosomal protein S6